MDEFPEDIIPLLKSCWAENPILRPEFKEITEILIKILHNLYTAKINALASIRRSDRVDINGEKESLNAQHTATSFVFTNDNETMRRNGGTEGVNSLTLDEIWSSEVISEYIYHSLT